LCFGLRLLAIRRDWQLPRAGSNDDNAQDERR
jgi:hypothetical protein